MTADSLIDPQLDDTGYSELFTVEDFIREAEQVGKWLSGDRISIHWNLLKYESLTPQKVYRPRDSWSLGVYRGDWIYENNFTSKSIHS